MGKEKDKVDENVTLPLRNRISSEYGKAIKVSSGARIDFHFKKYIDGLHRFIVEESDNQTDWQTVPQQSLSEAPPVFSGHDQGKTKESIYYKGKKKYIRVNVQIEDAYYGSLYEVKITQPWIINCGCLAFIILIPILALGSCFASGDKQEEKKQQPVTPIKQETAEKSTDLKEELSNEKKTVINEKTEEVKVDEKNDENKEEKKEENKEERKSKETKKKKESTKKKSSTSKSKRDSTSSSSSSSTKKKRSGCYIKGNINSKGEKIYHVPGGQFYNRTNPERCFDSEAAARAAGYRKSKR